MAEERIDSIVASTATKELDDLKSRLTDLSDQIVQINRTGASIELKLGDTTSVMDMNKLMKELNGNLQTANKLTLEQAKAANQLAQAEEHQAKATLLSEQAAEKKVKTQAAEIKLADQLQKGIDKLNATRAKEEKQINELTNDYAILSKAYQDAALRAKNYAIQLGDNHTITVQATADAKAMGDRLKQLDASVGQFQRNVGNYNMVGAQFNQVLRELPNLAISARTFIISLSNNITYLAESFIQARREGASFGAIMRGVFSKGNLIVLGINVLITAFTFLATRVATTKKEVVKELSETEKAFQEFANNAGAELGKVEVLSTIIADNTASLERRKGAIAELRKLYPAYLQDITDEQLLTSQANEAYSAIINSIYRKARAMAYQQQLNSLIAKEIELQERLRDLGVDAVTGANRLGKDQDPNSFLYRDLTEDEKRRIKNEQSVKGLMKDLEDNRRRQGEFTKVIAQNTDFIDKGTESVSKNVENIRKDIISLKPLFMDIDPSSILPSAAPDTRIADLQLEEVQRLRMLEEAYTNNRISFKEYQDGKLKVARDITTQIIKLQIQEAQAVIAAGGITTEELIKLETVITQLSQKLRELNTPATTQQSFVTKLKSDIQGIIPYAQQLASVMSSIGQAITANAAQRTAALDAEIERIDRIGQQEVDHLRYRGASEKEIRAQEAETAAQRSRLEQQKIRERQKSAAFEKATALMQAIVNTAAAVVEALPNIPLSVAVGVAGAAQIAVIAAQPMPKYAKGTQNHPGGLAQVAENEPELIVERNRAYMVHKPSVLDLPKHTKVFNQQQLMNMYNPLIVQKLNNNRDKKIEDAIISGTRRTVQAISKQRTNINIQAQSNINYLKHVKGK